MIRPMTFDELAQPGPVFRNTSHLIPIESVVPGDEQVFAARGSREGEPVIDLGCLEDYLSVESVVASTEVRLRQPLPHIRELLVFGSTPIPDSETFANLPGLERLWVAWASARRPLAVGQLPVSLRALGVCRHILGTGTMSSPGFSQLAKFSRLSHLTLIHCWPQDSVAPLAALRHLTEVRADAPSGWSALRACTSVERVAAICPRMTNLRSLKTWARLRDLTLTGSGVRALSGLEAFTSLERLRLVMLTVDDLAPVRGLRRLAHVELVGLRHLKDISTLADLSSLRRLVIARAGVEYRDIVHIESLGAFDRAQALEELTLQGTVIDDGDLWPVARLPALRRVRLFGDLRTGVDELRRARPDLEVTWHPAESAPGERVGLVFIRPPSKANSNWWIREDLTEALGVQTNYDAEERLRSKLAAEHAVLLSRLKFDTEGDAVSVDSPREEDLRVVARVIEQLAGE